MVLNLFPKLPPEKAKPRTVIVCVIAGVVLLAALIAAVIFLIPGSDPVDGPTDGTTTTVGGQQDTTTTVSGDPDNTTVDGDPNNTTVDGGQSGSTTTVNGQPGTNPTNGGQTTGTTVDSFVPVIRPQDGYVSVIDFGAVPSDNGDDTEAFRRAAKSGYGIFVPAGEYRLSGTIELNGQDLVGEAQTVAIIRGTSDQTLFRLKGNCKLANVTVGYANGTAGRGAKTAVRIAPDDSYALSPAVMNVKFTQVGTAVFVEKGKTNGVRLEDVAVDNFGYAGVVFDGSGSRNAILRSVYITKSLSGAAYGVELQGDEGTLLEQVTVESSSLKQALRFDGSVAFSIKTAQFVSVKADAMVGGNKCGGRVGSLYLQSCTGKTTAFTSPVGGAIDPEYTYSK